MAGLLKDERWMLTDKEKNHLAGKLDKVLYKYVPTWSFEYKDELDLALGLSTYLIIKSQSQPKPFEPEKKDNKKPEKQTNGSNTGISKNQLHSRIPG